LIRAHAVPGSIAGTARMRDAMTASCAAGAQRTIAAQIGSS
jgi:hypothetical protein